MMKNSLPIVILFILLITVMSCEIISVTTNDDETTTNTTTEITTTTTIELTTTTTEDIQDQSWLKVSGFAQSFISNRVGKTNEDSDYAVVNNEETFIQALDDEDIKIIEITSDLNLGYLELSKTFDVSNYSILREHHRPLLHPTLMQTGVSRIYIQDRDGLLIFSKTGNTIKHASFNIKRSRDVVFRNLRFDELWEFDEHTKGNYDRNDWDYFTLEENNGVWFDHLEFGRSYDGLIDIKEGSQNTTISWSKFIFEPTQFIYDQFNYLEENQSVYPMYHFLRSEGMTVDEIVQLYSPQKKGHLVGSSEFEEGNEDLSLTLHHNYYKDLQDRLPRLRGGNVHLFNVILDCDELYLTKIALRNRYTNVFSTSEFKTGLTNQGIVTTENGAVLMENSIFKGVSTPIKNNQKNQEIRYTGKYQVINSIYEINERYFIGSSEDDETPFFASQVTPLAFSWNEIERLPYTYQLTDVLHLEDYFNQGYLGAIDNEAINWLSIERMSN